MKDRLIHALAWVLGWVLFLALTIGFVLLVTARW